jgi:hypothetical protein
MVECGVFDGAFWALKNFTLFRFIFGVGAATAKADSLRE